MSPRQRMINLMYIILTALLALHVSRDVLNGFHQMQQGLSRTNDNLTIKNENQYKYLETLYSKNPVKTGPWLEKSNELKSRTATLISQIDSLKLAIAVKADGADGDPANIKNIDNLEAASVTMLNPFTKKGEHLRQEISGYSMLLSSLITDSIKRGALVEILNTDVNVKDKDGSNLNWEETMFDKVPAISAVTMLTKLQNDIKQAEGEALSSIITNIDIGDVRVNELKPYVMPESKYVVRGGQYVADIVLAAIDTTQRPMVYVNGDKIENGKLRFSPTGGGTHEISGYMEIVKGDGFKEKIPFSSSYTVVEPMATISATMMNVLYAGIENPVSISVPGVPLNVIEASISNGSISRKGDAWIVRPGEIGKDAVISVFATINGRKQQMGQMAFKVRKLPDPSPFISLKDAQGNYIEYKGSPKRISKAQLLSVEKLGAAIDDNLLNVSYSVVSFSTVFFDSMGNAIPEVSDGESFSARQKEQFRRLKPGARFFISNVKAKGPDGITRDISPMEVALN